MIQKNYYDAIKKEWDELEREMGEKSERVTRPEKNETTKEFEAFFEAFEKTYPEPKLDFTYARSLNFVKLARLAIYLAQVHSWNFCVDVKGERYGRISFSAEVFCLRNSSIYRAIFNLLNEASYSTTVSIPAKGGTLVEYTLMYDLTAPLGTDPLSELLSPI